MKFKSCIIAFFSIVLLIGFFVPDIALADTVTISGTVTNSSGIAISDATVQAMNPQTGVIDASATTMQDTGGYTLVVPTGTFNIQVTPANDSGLSSAIALNEIVNNDMTVNFVLTPVNSLTLSGLVSDSLGNGVPYQRVQFGDDSGITDSTGHYSFLTTPGTKTLGITNTPVHQNDYTLNVPGQYTIYIENYAITQSTSNLDLTIPAKKVTFEVRDPENNPVSGVMINAYHNRNYVNDGGLSIGSGITNASADFSEYASDTSPKTDKNGNVVEWLLPNNNSFSYNFRATPPADGIYTPFDLNDRSITGTVTMLISLQYLHPPTNNDPVVGDITFVPNPVEINSSTTATGTFTDQDASDTHSAVWTWGDGNSTICSATSTDCTLTETNGEGTVSATHSYASTGVYTVTLEVTDNAGAKGTKTYQYAVVYDPDGGFVTGGGWIISPTGAYPADTTLTGKANFGFVSKYQKGKTVPEGNTEFNFSIANFNFHSTSYDWLVISGSKAQYKGEGTINGQGNYKFILSATDGSPDKFRLKVWNADNNTTMYDNQQGATDDTDPATAIGGGSIVIHK